MNELFGRPMCRRVSLDVGRRCLIYLGGDLHISPNVFLHYHSYSSQHNNIHRVWPHVSCVRAHAYVCATASSGFPSVSSFLLLTPSQPSHMILLSTHTNTGLYPHHTSIISCIDIHLILWFFVLTSFRTPHIYRSMNAHYCNAKLIFPVPYLLKVSATYKSIGLTAVLLTVPTFTLLPHIIPYILLRFFLQLCTVLGTSAFHSPPFADVDPIYMYLNVFTLCTVSPELYVVVFAVP